MCGLAARICGFASANARPQPPYPLNMGPDKTARSTASTDPLVPGDIGAEGEARGSAHLVAQARRPRPTCGWRILS